MKKIKLLIADCLLRIAEGKLKIADCGLRSADSKKTNAYPLVPNNYSLVPPNTLTTFPHYLKKPIRFWSTNVGDEIRSNFDLELYCKVCEARGLSSGVRIEG
jgi:hypothetical protein